MVNPARAGMILDEYYALRNYLRKPRASGDDPGYFATTAQMRA